MNVVNADVEPGEEPVVNSRYSIVLATAKRARQLINGAEPMVTPTCNKPLSIAVAELNEGQVKILTEGEAEETLEDVTEGLGEDEILDDGFDEILNPEDAVPDEVPEEDAAAETE